MVETYTVEFIDLDRTIEVAANEPILEAAEAAGIDLPYQCRMGICGVCSAKLAEGSDPSDVEQTEGMFLSGSEKEEGYVLTCIAKPRNDLKLRADDGP